MSDLPGPSADASAPRLVVGQVRGLHGLRGAVRIEVLTDDLARFDPGSVVYLEGTPQRLTVLESSADGPGLLVRFQERPDRTSVEDLRERYLEAGAPAEPLPDGAFYWHELLGIAVQDAAGADLGRVVDVFRAGGAEVFVVQGPRGELMVPGVATVVRELVPAEGRMVVDADALDLDDRPPRSRVRGRRTTRARKAAERGEGTGPATEDGAVGDASVQAAPAEPSTPTTEGADPQGA